MKKIEEQLESIEEVLTQLVKKLSDTEETAEKMAADNNTRNLLADLRSSIAQMPSGQQLQGQMASIQTCIENLPGQSQVKHHHHFDLHTRGFIISASVLLIISAISVGIAVANHGENSRLRAMDVKYRMVRQFNPKIVAWTDSLYYHNPELAERETEKREDHELVVKDAEALLKQKQQETKSAQDLLKKLKKD